MSIGLTLLLVLLTLSPSMRGGFPGGGSVSAAAEAIITVQSSDCTTPKSSWDLGESACAKATDAPEGRRIAWVAPNGAIAQVSNTFTGTTSDTYAIPTIASGDPFAQPGTWTVQTIDGMGVGFAFANFVVRDPANARADVAVGKYCPDQAAAGSSISYRVEVTNNGPDTAVDVIVTDAAPANTTFSSSNIASCPDPSAGCNIGSLASGATVVYTLTYDISAGATNGTVISNTVQVSSSTLEPSVFSQSNNSATCLTTVANAPAPGPCSITCPSPISQNAVSGQCSAAVTYTTPSGTGTCTDPESGQTPPVTCSPPSGAIFPVGTSTVTCALQAASCSFTITVNDTRPATTPTILCPANKTVNENPAGSGSAFVSYANPSVTGNCVSVSCSPPSGARFSAGTTTVNCTATDSSNQSVTCSFIVTVNTTTCTLDCPDDKTVNESSAGSGSATVTYSNAVTVGSCPSLTITCNPPSGSSFSVGLTPVSCTGEDNSNNVVATCGFTVTVNSLPACSITCPANVTSASQTVTYPAPTTSGNCSSVLCNPPSGSTFPIGTSTVHCNGTDPAGNTNSCSFTVTVTGGGTSCSIVCPGNITQSSAGCGNTVTYADPTTSGSCGDGLPPWSCNPPSGSFFPVGTTTVTCITDVGSQCSFTVVISGDDAVAPTINSCATPTFALADPNCQAVVPNVTSDVDATDNCTPTSSLIITQNPASGTVVNSGTNTITVTVKDANNNSSTCTTTFTVFETVSPTAICKNFTIALNAGGTASITGADVDNGSSDNCAIASRTVTPNTFTCANKGANTVTLTVADPSGNTASCQATVTVVDITPPSIVCPSSIVKSTDPNLCTAVTTYANATATDNCSGVGTPSCTPPSGSAFPKGTTVVTCSVSDASNNSSSCTFSVTVNDTQPPAITCQADVTVAFDPAVGGAVVTYTAPVGTDNCPGAATAQIAGSASGSSFPLGTTTNTFRVTDAAGLTATCSFKVTVALTSIVGVDSVSISGSGLVDSYSSTGGYPASKGSLASVVSNGTVTLAGSSKVFGDVRSTRVGVVLTGTSQVTGNATAGTTVSKGASAVVGGTITNNALAPVIALPAVVACGPPYSPNTGISGTYSYNASTGDLSLSGINVATLANGTYCFHNVTLTNSAQLKVNGPVVIKLTGTLSTSGATSLPNTTTIPSNLVILSSYSGSNGVVLGNSSTLQLVVYAPNTDVTITGAAPLFGTVAGKTVTVSNSGMIHYDTTLLSIWPTLWPLILAP